MKDLSLARERRGRRLGAALRGASLLALALACLVGCGGTAEQAASDSADVTSTTPGADGWQAVGIGVSYRQISSGDKVFLGYGGFGADPEAAKGWVTELWRARLSELGVGHLYAIRGPADVGYAGAEIGNSKIVAHLRAHGPDGDILVAAHSSGSYVAHELLRLVDRQTLSKIAYYNLDGGGSGLTSEIVGGLRAAYFVYAIDGGLAQGRSANAATMISLGRAYRSAKTFEVVADGSGCVSGAKWCLHDTLITTHPHNPHSFDLASDYRRFDAAHAVVADYLDPREAGP